MFTKDIDLKTKEEIVAQALNTDEGRVALA